MIRIRAAWGSVFVLPLFAAGCMSGKYTNPQWFSVNTPTPTTTAAKVTAPSRLSPEQSANACIAAADELEKKGHFREAGMELELARQHNPKINVSHRLGRLYDKQDESEKALAEYRVALRLAPRDSELLNDLGYCCYQRGDAAEAEQWLRQAIEADPKNSRAQVNLGLVLGQRGQYREALAVFGRVVSPAEAHQNLAFVYAKQGKLTESREEYSQALAIDPNLKASRTALVELDRMFAGGNEPAQAKKPSPPQAPAQTASRSALPASPTPDVVQAEWRPVTSLAAAQAASGVSLQAPVPSGTSEPKPNLPPITLGSPSGSR